MEISHTSLVKRIVVIGLVVVLVSFTSATLATGKRAHAVKGPCHVSDAFDAGRIDGIRCQWLERSRILLRQR